MLIFLKFLNKSNYFSDEKLKACVDILRTSEIFLFRFDTAEIGTQDRSYLRRRLLEGNHGKIFIIFCPQWHSERVYWQLRLVVTPLKVWFDRLMTISQWFIWTCRILIVVHLLSFSFEDLTSNIQGWKVNTKLTFLKRTFLFCTLRSTNI